MGSYGENPTEENDFPDAVLNYTSQILMEEDLENATITFPDATLEAVEKSFYDELGGKFQSSINQTSLDQNATCSCSCNYIDCNKKVNKLVESSSICDLHEQKSCYGLDPPVKFESSSWSIWPPNNFDDTFSGLVDHCADTVLVQGSFGESRSVLQCKEGIKGTCELLSYGNRMNFDIKNNRLIPPELKLKKPLAVAEVGKAKRDHSLSGLMERKNHPQLESESQRQNKHLALYHEEYDYEQSEMFDKVLLSNGGDDDSAVCTVDKAQPNGQERMVHRSGQTKGSNGRGTGRKKWVNKGDLVDLWPLLMHCAEAVGGNDLKSANELLLKIRQHSSPFGDGSQRLAYCFAIALEARLLGTGSEVYDAGLTPNRMSAVHILKAWRFFLSACPFLKMSNFFATEMIMKLAEKATRLHIIHFGVLYGFQWPGLIQLLSTRPGGPPVLRITEIDIPQPGFRPAARAEETGLRLANYCQRFNVPFEYNAIAQKWDSIQFEDLKIDRDEVTVVNCLYRFRYLLDESVLLTSPRDAVLNLVNRINPDVFIHGIINGAYNAPFFISRFREALYYFSAMFDVFEANAPQEDQDRMVLEQIYGNEVLNVIACEGAKRIERPVTYKQWQARNLRAGLRQLPLNQEIMNKVRAQVKLCFHKEFLVDEDSQWMLQGWKGRILFALSCWKSA